MYGLWLLPAPLQASFSVQPFILLTALYIKCAVGVTCLYTPLLVTLCSVPFQLNKYIHKRGHFLSPEGENSIPISLTLIHFGELRGC